MILIGELSLWVALLMAAWGAAVSIAGGALRRADLIASGERAVYATFALIVLASIGLWTALLTHDFSIDYVARNTSRNMPALYLVAAVWAGKPGSLLVWALILGGLSTIAIVANRNRNGALMPWVTGTLAVILGILLATTALGASPFARGPWVPIEGHGMPPRLQHPAMALHPPILYLGYVATTIPFAFAIAALIARRLDADWLAAVRRWSVAAWFFLTCGILLGMWWAYVEPGWSGNWAWDPVTNASVLPWLTMTALLCSIMAQEKRCVFGKWNVVLVVMSFPLAILATFITRGGTIESVQSFAGLPIAGWFAGFIILSIAATGYLVMTRLGDLGTTASLESRRRRYGGHVVQAGAVFLVVAFAGSAFRAAHDVSLGAGERFAVRDPIGQEWVFTSQGVSLDRVRNREVVAVALDVMRDGVRMPPIVSETRQYFDGRGVPTFEPSTEAGIRTTPSLDAYVVLTGVARDATERAELRIVFNPLRVWVWIGGALIAFGGLVVMWPPAERRRALSHVPVHQPRTRAGHAIPHPVIREDA